MLGYVLADSIEPGAGVCAGVCNDAVCAGMCKTPQTALNLGMCLDTRLVASANIIAISSCTDLYAAG